MNETEENCNNEFQPEPEEIPDIERVRQECDLLRKESLIEADKILEQAREEAEKKAEIILEEAWQKGYSEGIEAAQAQCAAMQEETERIRESAAQEHDSILAGMEAEILELVLKIARKVVAGELMTNNEVILQLIRDALSNCSNTNGAVVRVSPSDCDFLSNNKEKLSFVAENADGLEIKRDCSMNTGDCIIETPLGSVDAGANTRMHKIEEAFNESIKGIQG